MSDDDTGDVNFESIPEEEAIAVMYGGNVYKLAPKKFLCPECDDGTILSETVYTNEHEVEGVTALALGVECPECGYDTLHIAY